MYSVIGWASVIIGTIFIGVGIYDDFFSKNSSKSMKWWNSSVAMFLFASFNFSYS